MTICTYGLFIMYMSALSLKLQQVLNIVSIYGLFEVTSELTIKCKQTPSIKTFTQIRSQSMVEGQVLSEGTIVIDTLHNCIHRMEKTALHQTW